MELTLHLTMHLTDTFAARTNFIDHARKLGTALKQAARHLLGRTHRLDLPPSTVSST